MRYPKTSRARITGEIGVNYVSSLVNNEFNWIFRRNSLDYDYGVDGYIDVVTDTFEVTGQSCAVQIKTDAGFFKTLKNGHYEFRGNVKHLNYYLNLKTPVVIIIVHPETRDARWVEFEASSTIRSGNHWKIHVPDENRFDQNAKPQLIPIFGELADHTDALKAHWAFQDTLRDSDFIVLTLDREEDIEAGFFGNFLEFFKRVTANPSIARKFQGRIEMMIAGYDDDPREMFEVPEFTSWMKSLDKIWFYWFFFANTHDPVLVLKLYLVCICDGRFKSGSRIPSQKMQIDFDREKLPEFMKRGFIGQNTMSEKFGIDDDQNQLISQRVVRALFPDFPN